MTRRLSLITVVAIAALSIGAPAAFAEGRLAGSIDETTAVYPDWFERAAAVAVKKHQAETMLNARDRGLGVYPDSYKRTVVVGQPDPRHSSLVARQRALEAQAQPFDARSDGLNRIYGLGEYAPKSDVTGYRDSFERGAAVLTPSQRAELLRSQGLNKMYGLGEFAKDATVSTYKDAAERAVPPTTSVPVSVSSGTDIEWPQIGVGLGIGILLALGLGLIMRAVHIRPFAH